MFLDNDCNADLHTGLRDGKPDGWETVTQNDPMCSHIGVDISVPVLVLIFYSPIGANILRPEQ